MVMLLYRKTMPIKVAYDLQNTRILNKEAYSSLCNYSFGDSTGKTFVANMLGDNYSPCISNIKSAQDRFASRNNEIEDLPLRMKFSDIVASTPEGIKLISDYFNDSFQNGQISMSIYNLFGLDDLKALYRSLYPIYLNAQRETFRWLESNKNNFIDEFSTKITEFTKLFNIELSQEYVINCLKEIVYVCSDGHDKYGRYDACYTKEGAIGFKTLTTEQINNGFGKNLLYHEWVHAIAGMGSYYFPDRINPIHIYKNGLKLIVPKANDEKNNLIRFNWLNEGLTEYIAFNLTGLTFNNESERKILELLSHSVSLDLFLAVYFEVPKPQSNTGLPAWRSLAREIATNFESGFLVKLDEMMNFYYDATTLEPLINSFSRKNIQSDLSTP